MAAVMEILKRPLGRPAHYRGQRYLNKNRWLSDLYFITSQLDGIVSGNFLLVRGLEIAALEAPRPHVRAILSRLAEDLANGLALHEAMARLNRFFPPWYVDLVRVGEETGQLTSALSELGDRVWEHRAWRDKLLGAIMYVGAVLTIQFSIIVFLFQVVGPTFVEIFTDFEVSAPLLHFFAGTEAIREVVTGVAAVGVAIFAGLVLRRLIRGRVFGVGPLTEMVLWFGVYCPGLRNLARHITLAQPVQVLAMLMRAGVPLDEALVRAGDTDSPRFVRRAFQRMARKVRQGTAIGEAAESEQVLPASFKSALALGAESGGLCESLSALAARYRRESLKYTRVLLDVVLPIAVVLIGVLTLLVHVAFFGGIVAIFDEGANWV